MLVFEAGFRIGGREVREHDQERLHIDGLGQMSIESGLFALPAIAFLTPAGQGDQVIVFPHGSLRKAAATS